MASKIKLFMWLSLLNVAHGISMIFLGVVSINNTDFYEGLFGMGFWLGGLVSVSIINGSRIQACCNCFCYSVLRICFKNLSVRFECA